MASHTSPLMTSLPAPGTMVPLSAPFNPPILKGIKVHPDNPFRFDFILDTGDPVETPFMASHPSPFMASHPSPLKAYLQNESIKLIKYFLASLTIPEADLWVNLSPYEKNRIIPQSFGLTEMGRDLLAEDYMLKQITASLIYPEGEVGKKFWKRIYEEASKKFGTTNIPVNTFNKVWIVPEKAVVYENAKAGTAYVVESKLKVMLEEDYLSLNKHQQNLSSPNVSVGDLNTSNTSHTIASNIVREIILPELSKEVNEDKNFAQLRQVYNSLILATWYKKKIKDSILAKVYADKNKVAGVGYEKNFLSQNVNSTLSSPNALIGDPEYIYQQYLKAFKKGVFNYIKEEPIMSSPNVSVGDPNQTTIPRKYFSGGMNFAMTSLKAGSTLQILDQEPRGLANNSKAMLVVAMKTDPADEAMSLNDGDINHDALVKKVSEKYGIAADVIGFFYDWTLEDWIDSDIKDELMNNLKLAPLIYRGDRLDNILSAIINNNGYLATAENPYGSHLSMGLSLVKFFAKDEGQFVLKFSAPRLTQRQKGMFIRSTRMYHAKDSVMGPPADLRALTDENKQQLWDAWEAKGMLDDSNRAHVREVLWAPMDKDSPVQAWKQFEQLATKLTNDDWYEIWGIYHSGGVDELIDKIKELADKNSIPMPDLKGLWGTTFINHIEFRLRGLQGEFQRNDNIKKEQTRQQIYELSFELLVKGSWEYIYRFDKHIDRDTLITEILTQGVNYFRENDLYFHLSKNIGLINVLGKEGSSYKLNEVKNNLLISLGRPANSAMTADHAMLDQGKIVTLNSLSGDGYVQAKDQIDALAEIENEKGTMFPVPVETWQKIRLDDQHSQLSQVSLGSSGKVMGFVLAYPDDAHSAIIEKFAVAEALRRNGEGSRLMHALAQRAKKVGIQELYLAVLKTNKAAQERYVAMGFENLTPQAKRQDPRYNAFSFGVSSQDLIAKTTKVMSVYDKDELAKDPRTPIDIYVEYIKRSKGKFLSDRNIEQLKLYEKDFAGMFYTVTSFTPETVAERENFLKKLPNLRGMFEKMEAFSQNAYQNNENSEEARKFLWKISKIALKVFAENDHTFFDKHLPMEGFIPYDDDLRRAPIVDIATGVRGAHFMKSLGGEHLILTDRSYFVEGFLNAAKEYLGLGDNIVIRRVDVQDLQQAFPEAQYRFVRMGNIDSYVRFLPEEFYTTLMAKIPPGGIISVEDHTGYRDYYSRDAIGFLGRSTKNWQLSLSQNPGLIYPEQIESLIFRHLSNSDLTRPTLENLIFNAVLDSDLELKMRSNKGVFKSEFIFWDGSKATKIHDLDNSLPVKPPLGSDGREWSIRFAKGSSRDQILEAIELNIPYLAGLLLAERLRNRMKEIPAGQAVHLNINWQGEDQTPKASLSWDDSGTPKTVQLHEATANIILSLKKRAGVPAYTTQVIVFDGQHRTLDNTTETLNKAFDPAMNVRETYYHGTNLANVMLMALGNGYFRYGFITTDKGTAGGHYVTHGSDGRLRLENRSTIDRIEYLIAPEINHGWLYHFSSELFAGYLIGFDLNEELIKRYTGQENYNTWIASGLPVSNLGENFKIDFLKRLEDFLNKVLAEDKTTGGLRKVQIKEEAIRHARVNLGLELDLTKLQLVTDKGRTAEVYKDAEGNYYKVSKVRVVGTGSTLAANNAPLENEIRIMKVLKGNKYVPEILNDGTYDQHRWFKYRPISGSKDLDDIFWQKLPLRDWIITLKNISVEVEDLHKRGFSHNDIVGMNILRNDAGEIQLIDFGAARLRDPKPGKTYDHTLSFERMLDLLSLTGLIYKTLMGNFGNNLQIDQMKGYIKQFFPIVYRIEFYEVQRDKIDPDRALRQIIKQLNDNMEPFLKAVGNAAMAEQISGVKHPEFPQDKVLGNKALMDAWSKGPEAINELVYQARRLGFEGGVFIKRNDGYVLKPFQGSLSDMVFGPPLFDHYVHPILVSSKWDGGKADFPGEIWWNVRVHAKSDAVFLWRESQQGYECLMFDYGPGFLSGQKADLTSIFRKHETYRAGGHGLGTWLYGKYSYLTRLVSMNQGKIQVVDKTPGYFTDEKDSLDISHKVVQTDLPAPLGSHGFIVHAFVPFNKGLYKGRFTPVSDDNILGSINTDHSAPIDRDEIWRQTQAIETNQITDKDIGRPVDINVHADATKRKSIRISGRLESYNDYLVKNGTGEPLSSSFMIVPMENNFGIKGKSSIKILYSQVREIKTPDHKITVRTEKDARKYISNLFDYSFPEPPPVEITYEERYDVGEIQQLSGVITRAPSAETQGALEIKTSDGQIHLIGIDRIKEFTFTDKSIPENPAMNGRELTNSLQAKLAEVPQKDFLDTSIFFNLVWQIPTDSQFKFTLKNGRILTGLIDPVRTKTDLEKPIIYSEASQIGLQGIDELIFPEDIASIESENLSDHDINNYINGPVYVKSNEHLQELTIKALRDHPAQSNEIHIGVSGLFNLDMIAAHRSPYALLIDRSGKTRHFYEKIKEMILSSTTRQQFISTLTAYIGTREGQEFASKQDAQFLQESLDNQETWIGSDENFFYIKEMFNDNRLFFLRSDFRNNEEFKKIAEWLRENKLRAGTIYISNIREWMWDHRGGGIPQENLKALIDSLALVSDKGTQVIEAVENSIDYPMTQQIFRADNYEPLKGMKLGMDPAMFHATQADHAIDELRSDLQLPSDGIGFLTNYHLMRLAKGNLFQGTVGDVVLHMRSGQILQGRLLESAFDRTPEGVRQQKIFLRQPGTHTMLGIQLGKIDSVEIKRDSPDLSRIKAESGHIFSNEIRKSVFKAIGEVPLRPNAVHCGAGGVFNFDIMFLRHSSYGVLFDQDLGIYKFFTDVEETIKDSSDRYDFVKKMLGKLEGDNIALMQEELTRNGSWLSTDKGFNYIKGMFQANKIIYFVTDIMRESVFKSIQTWLGQNGLHIDTLWISDILTWFLDRQIEHTRLGTKNYDKIFQGYIAGYFNNIDRILSSDSIVIYSQPKSADPGDRFNLIQHFDLGQNYQDLIIAQYPFLSKTNARSAMATPALKDTGGIDLTKTNMYLQTKDENGKISFHLDPAMMEALKNAPGFVPVIISIEPMKDLELFLSKA